MTEESLSEVQDIPFDAHDLGPQLEPVLVEACEGKLHDIHWFKVDWQRGGAATAYGQFRFDDGPDKPVVIKFPVGPQEYRFTTLLSTTEAPTPRLAAHGVELGGYDFAWLVMERLPGDPLAARIHKEVFRELAAACVGFSIAADAHVPAREDDEPPQADWAELLERARAAIKNTHIPDEQSWNNAIRDVQKHVVRLQSEWRARDTSTWCHGDLHAGNLMHRTESLWGDDGCVLLDLAEVHRGHWVEDAVYLERLYWGREEAIKGIKPVSLLARARRDRGLDTSDDYASIANLRRVLLAACVPAFLHREGHPKYLAAALKILDRLVPQVTG